jgi:hypothetical protein
MRFEAVTSHIVVFYILFCILTKKNSIINQDICSISLEWTRMHIKLHLGLTFIS